MGPRRSSHSPRSSSRSPRNGSARQSSRGPQVSRNSTRPHSQWTPRDPPLSSPPRSPRKANLAEASRANAANRSPRYAESQISHREHPPYHEEDPPRNATHDAVWARSMKSIQSQKEQEAKESVVSRLYTHTLATSVLLASQQLQRAQTSSSAALPASLMLPHIRAMTAQERIKARTDLSKQALGRSQQLEATQVQGQGQVCAHARSHAHTQPGPLASSQNPRMHTRHLRRRRPPK